MKLRKKHVGAPGNGGEFTRHQHRAVDIDDLWGDDTTPVEEPDDTPEEPAAAAETNERPCVVCEGAGGRTGRGDGIHRTCRACDGTGLHPDITDAQIGTVANLRAPAHYSGQSQDVIVTEHNADLVGLLTQEDIDQRSDLWFDLGTIERNRINTAVTVDDVTLPTDPTPEDIQRVATNVDKAFTIQTAYLSGAAEDATRVLREAHGTPDRAIVAVGAAVANLADNLADGPAAGGAKAAEQRWIERCKAQEAAEREAWLIHNRDRHAGKSDDEIMAGFYKSRDLVDFEAARDPRTRKTIAAMSDAYTKALSEVREMGGPMSLHDSSAKPGAKVVAATAAVWPADWLERHNNHEVPLRIAASRDRGHYVHEHVDKIKKRGQGVGYIENVDVESSLFEGRRGFSHLTSQVSLDDNGVPVPRGTWVQGDRISTYSTYEKLSADEKAELGFAPDANSYRVLEWEYRDVDQAKKEYRDYLLRAGRAFGLDDGRAGDLSSLDDDRLLLWVRDAAQRNNYKLEKHPIEGGEVVTDPKLNKGLPFYRKPKIRMNEVTSAKVSTIQLSKDRFSGAPGSDPRYAVAVHEVGHRMEYLVPNLNAMARTWRERRVGESPTDEGRELRAIYRGTSEVGYTDEFVSHYIGKSYDKHLSSRTRRPRGVPENFVGATEVFSMGSESLFGGTNGGLIGLSRDKRPDDDMKNFILGVFASAGTYKESRR